MRFHLPLRGEGCAWQGEDGAWSTAPAGSSASADKPKTAGLLKVERPLPHQSCLMTPRAAGASGETEQNLQTAGRVPMEPTSCNNSRPSQKPVCGQDRRAEPGEGQSAHDAARCPLAVHLPCAAPCTSRPTFWEEFLLQLLSSLKCPPAWQPCCKVSV